MLLGLGFGVTFTGNRAITPANYHVLIGAGASNMLGPWGASGYLEDSSTDPVLDAGDPRILMLPSSGGNAGQVVPAAEPLPHAAQSLGIGPLLSAAKRRLQDIPATDKIVIVPCATGGTNLVYTSVAAPVARWSPTTPGDLYTNLLTRMGQVRDWIAGEDAEMASSVLLWSQANGDAGGTAPDVYATALTTLLTNARAVIGFSGMGVVVMYSRPPEFLGNGLSPAAPSNLWAQLTAAETLTKTATTDGVIGYHGGDKPTTEGGSVDPSQMVHYTAAGNRIMGERAGAQAAPALLRGSAGVYGRDFLDGLSVAPSAAWSFRRLTSGATIAGQYQPGAEGEPADIGFTANGHADFLSIGAGLAKTTALLTSWKDQIAGIDLGPIDGTSGDMASVFGATNYPWLLGMRPSLRHSSPSLGMFTTGFLPAANGWISIVFEPTNGSSTWVGSSAVCLESRTSGQWALRPGGNGSINAFTVPAGPNHILAKYGPTAGDMEIYLNGALVVGGISSAAITNTNSGSLSVGAQRNNTPALARGAQGKLAELVFWPEGLTAGDRAAVFDACRIGGGYFKTQVA